MTPRCPRYPPKHRRRRTAWWLYARTHAPHGVPMEGPEAGANPRIPIRGMNLLGGSGRRHRVGSGWIVYSTPNGERSASRQIELLIMIQ